MDHGGSTLAREPPKSPYFRGPWTGAELARLSMMGSLPRFRLPDDESSDTLTVRLSSPELDALPRQFVLELPESFALLLTAPHTPFAPRLDDREPAPPPPWATQATKVRGLERHNFLSVLASAIVGCAVVVAGVAAPSGAPESSDPVGIAVRAPKTLDKSVRTRDRIAGVSLPMNAVTVSVDSLARSRRRRF